MTSSGKAWDIVSVSAEKDSFFDASLTELAREWQAGDEHFWSHEEILASLARPEVWAYFAVASGSRAGSNEDRPRWIGFLLAEIGPFSTDLLYIHVHRGARRSGLGRALLARLIDDLEKTPAQEALFLEVRAGNMPAQNLYRELGIVQVGRRPRYYTNGDDALVFKKELEKRTL